MTNYNESDVPQLCKVHIYAHPDYGTKVVWGYGKIEQL